MEIIDIVLAADNPVPLAAMSRLSHIPKPTVRRLAMNLSQRGLLIKGADGYLPGPQLAALGARAAEQIRSLSAPHLQELFERSRAVIWMVEVNSAKQLTLVNSVFDRTSLPYSSDWPFPRSLADSRLVATALGRVVLADEPERVESHLEQGIPRLTRHTAIHPRQVRAAIARAAGDGVAVEHEQVRLGWSCLAIPVAGPRPASAVLGVVDRTPRFDVDRLRRLALTTADGIGRDWRTR